MKIALIVSGGVDRSGRERVVPALLWLIERLARNHQILVIATHQEPRPARYELLGATIINLGYANDKPISNIKTLPRYFAQALRAIHSWGKPDLIHGLSLGMPGLLAVLIGKLLRIPVVASIWGGELAALPAIGYGGQLRLASRLMSNTVIQLADALTGGSHYVLDLLPKWRTDAHWIPLGVDSTLFCSPRVRPLAPPWRMLQVASINRVKDPVTLLQTIRQVAAYQPNFSLDWIGEDTLSSSIQQMAAQLGLSQQIRFHGFQPSEVVARMAQDAQIYVQSSLHESQGVAVLEAAAASVPTIGTAVGLVAELAPTAAVATRPRDAEQLSSAIIALFDNPAQQKAIAQAAHHFSQCHDADWSAATFGLLYEQLVDRSIRF